MLSRRISKKTTTRKEVNMERTEALAAFLVCVFVYMAVDAMSKWRSNPDSLMFDYC